VAQAKARLDEVTAEAEAELRSAVAAARQAGDPIRQIAITAGVSRPTIYDWIRASNAGGTNV